MKQLKQYNISADIIRILAAFFVVFSHSTDLFVQWPTLKGGSSWQIIYYFNTLSRIAVPLFVILSGYLILSKDKTNNLKEFYKRRFSRILIPFLFWLVFYYGWESYWNQTKITVGYIAQTLWIASIWHLYFLIVILELYLLAPLLVKLLNQSKIKQTITFIILLAISLLCVISANTGIHFNFERNFFTIFIPYMSYFYAGAYLKSWKTTKIQAVFLGAIYFILAFVTNIIAKGNNATFIIFNYSPTLFVMSIAFFLALKNIDAFFKAKLFSGLLGKIVLLLAPATFGIYLLHFVILDLVRKYFHLYPWELHTPLVFYALLPSIFTFSITFILVALGRRIPFVKTIFG